MQQYREAAEEVVVPLLITAARSPSHARLSCSIPLPSSFSSCSLSFALTSFIIGFSTSNHYLVYYF